MKLGMIILNLAYQILANYSKPLPSNRGMYLNVQSNQRSDIHDAGNYKFWWENYNVLVCFMLADSEIQVNNVHWVYMFCSLMRICSCTASKLARKASQYYCCRHIELLFHYFQGLSIFCFYFSFQQFFFSYLFCSIFCSLSGYFSTHKRFFLVYLQFLSMHDCCIRVIYNMVTALLEYLDLLVVFPEEHVDLILFVTILVEYLHLSNAK